LRRKGFENKVAPRKKPAASPDAAPQSEPVKQEEQDTPVVVEKPVFPTPQ
jgi:hypothetical protein